MKILCVEDGSVDIDKIETEGLQDGKILIYRQGATPPFVLNLDPNTYDVNRPNEYRINTAIEPNIIIRCLICGEETKRLHKIISETQTIDICDKCKKVVMKMREKQK